MHLIEGWIFLGGQRSGHTDMKAFVITRDRALYAHRCIRDMLAANLEVVIVDHGSTWPRMLRLLDAWEERDVHVIRRGDAHPRSLWADDVLISVLQRYDERFIVTDCDVIPERLDQDWVGALHTALTQFPDAVKAGLAFRTDDIPEHYEHRERVIQWESGYINSANLAGLVGGFAVYHASVDTTLAMYRRLTPEFELDPAIRIAFPYLARHLPWYEDSANLDEELQYYRDHLPQGISHWADPDAYARGAQ